MAVATIVALAGCGSSGTAAGGSPEAAGGGESAAAKHPQLGTPQHLPLLKKGVASVAVSGAGTISRRYTCDGADTSPPLLWVRPPHGTVEIILTVVGYRFIHGKPDVNWAVAGLSPKLTTLNPGRLPAGAVVGRNSSGKSRYELCPAKGPSQEYVISIFALPRRLHAKPGFDSVALRYKALHLASTEQLFGFSYKRA